MWSHTRVSKSRGISTVYVAQSGVYPPSRLFTTIGVARALTMESRGVSSDRRGQEDEVDYSDCSGPRSAALAMDKESTKRLDESAAVFSEVMATPDKGIPQEMLENAHCIVIVPGLKTGGFCIRREIRKGIPVLPQQSTARDGRRRPRSASKAAVSVSRSAGRRRT